MHRRSARRAAVIAAAVALALMAGAPAPAVAAAGVPGARDDWRWPVSPVQIVRSYEAPAHRYGPGHRGIDLAGGEDSAVYAPAAGVVAFAGAVAGRGIVTIDHGDGYVTTLEPVVEAPARGTTVGLGDPVGVVGVGGVGGHTEPDTVHFGVREHGEYINPMLLLGGIPRAILLPCC